MNFQEKIADATAELRACADSFAQAAFETARARAGAAASKVQGFRNSLAVLNDAGRQLNQVARRHARRFVKQNSPLVAAVREDVSQLARATISSLSTKQTSKKTRKPSATRKTTAGSRKRAARAA